MRKGRSMMRTRGARGGLGLNIRRGTVDLGLTEDEEDEWGIGFDQNDDVGMGDDF